MRLEDKKDYIAKNKIVEQYVAQIKTDYEQQIRKLNLGIAKLMKTKGGKDLMAAQSSNGKKVVGFRVNDED